MTEQRGRCLVTTRNILFLSGASWFVAALIYVVSAEYGLAMAHAGIGAVNFNLGAMQ